MKKNKMPSYLGGILIALGILGNKWVLDILLFPYGHMHYPVFSRTVVFFQATFICAGIYFILRKPSIHYDRVFLVVGSTVFSFFILEGSARVWLNYLATDAQARDVKLSGDVDQRSLQWSPHHYLDYYPTPNYRRGRTSHNSLGYRDREFSVHKPAGTFRIVALGGSTTYTEMVKDNEKTFTHQLENILRDEFNHRDVQVINAGVSGYNSWESLINLEFRVLDLNPDLIIIYHGTNDVHSRLVSPESYRGDNSGRRKQWRAPHVPLLVKHSVLLRIVSRKLRLGLFRPEGLESFVDAPTYRGALSRRPAADPMRLLDENPPIYFRRNLINMIAVAKANGVRVLLSTWAHSPQFSDYASTAHYERGFQENNSVVREVARECGAMLFDFAAEMPQEKRYWADGRHVNEAGARVKARLFADFIHRSGVFPSTDSADGGAHPKLIKDCLAHLATSVRCAAQSGLSLSSPRTIAASSPCIPRSRDLGLGRGRPGRSQNATGMSGGFQGMPSRKAAW